MVESWLIQTEGLLCQANEKTKVAKERAVSAVARAVDEYKKSEAFEDDAIEAGANAYVFSFNDCKNKVARAPLGLDLSDIIIDGVAPEEGRREGVGIVKEETTGVEGVVAEVLDSR